MRTPFGTAAVCLSSNEQGGIIMAGFDRGPVAGVTGDSLEDALGTAVSNRLAARPAAMVAAAGQLDALAGRIQAAQQTHSPAVHAAPAGAEEVSLTVSRNQWLVADSFDAAATAGARELRRAAEALRTQAAAYAATDAAGAGVVGPLF